MILLCTDKYRCVALADKRMSQIWFRGHLNRNSPLLAIFPNGTIPLVSFQSIIPRQEGCPPCYEVDVAKLSDAEKQALIAMLYQIWQHEAKSIQQIEKYVRMHGCPLKTEHFSSVSTNFNPMWLEDNLEDY